MCSVDLKSAYYSVPIDCSFRKYLRFSWQGQFYHFTCLPNGLSSAPRIFTKLLKPIFSFLRANGYCSVYYLDDSLLTSNNYGSCLENVEETVSVLKKSGFVINYEKSSLTPSKEIRFLALLINSERMDVALPNDRIQKIVDLGLVLLRDFLPSIRSLASFIGMVIAAFPAVKYGQLYYREMEKFKVKVLAKYAGDFDKREKLSDSVRTEIHWWVVTVPNSVNLIRQVKIDHVVDTDASLSGWVSVFGDEKTGGRWTTEESLLHINVLELKAVQFAVKSFFKDTSNVHVRIRSDNTTTVSYINKMGGIQSERCNEIAREICLYCKLRNIWISAEHLPGVNNSRADLESRTFSDGIEWTLEKKYFNCIIDRFGDVEIDLFASRLNAQVNQFLMET